MTIQGLCSYFSLLHTLGEVVFAVMAKLPRPIFVKVLLGPGGVPERLKGTGCKPVGYAYVGSNPTPSTTHPNPLGGKCGIGASTFGDVPSRIFEWAGVAQW